MLFSTCPSRHLKTLRRHGFFPEKIVIRKLTLHIQVMRKLETCWSFQVPATSAQHQGEILWRDPLLNAHSCERGGTWSENDWQQTFWCWLVGWLVGRLVGWLVGWLVDRLVGGKFVGLCVSLFFLPSVKSKSFVGALDYSRSKAELIEYNETKPNLMSAVCRVVKLSPDAPTFNQSITNHQSPITNHQSPITNHQSPITSVFAPTANQLRLFAFSDTQCTDTPVH